MSKVLSVALLVLGLAACSHLPTARATIASVEAAYTAAATTATAYVKLPRCGAPDAPTLCSSDAIVEQIDKANEVAYGLVVESRRVAQDPKATESKLALAVTAAQSAVTVMQQLFAVYGVKEDK